MSTTVKPDYAALFRIYADEHGYKRTGQPSALRVLGFMAWSLWNLPAVMLLGFLYGQEMQRSQADARAMRSTLTPQVWLSRWVALRSSHFTPSNRSFRAQVVRAMAKIHGINSTERNQHVR